MKATHKPINRIIYTHTLRGVLFSFSLIPHKINISNSDRSIFRSFDEYIGSAGLMLYANDGFGCAFPKKNEAISCIHHIIPAVSVFSNIPG